MDTLVGANGHIAASGGEDNFIDWLAELHVLWGKDAGRTFVEVVEKLQID